MARVVRLTKREPSRRGEPIHGVRGYDNLQVEGVLDEAEPIVDGQWKRAPFIAVWVLVDDRRRDYWGLLARDSILHAAYRLTDLRDWMDDNVAELERVNAESVPVNS